MRMVRKKRNRVKHFFLALLLFVVMFGGAFFGIQYLTKTGLFRIPGIVYYDESLTDVEKELLQSIFTEEVDLDKDVTISAENSLTKPESKDNEYLYQVFVPVTDFYSTETNITIEDPYS